MINKRFIRLWLLLTCWFTALQTLGQEYSYVHYDVKDGLAGSTVYEACQDTDGFIWFATEAGVSRFDGVNFRNFTSNDGLPETEVVRVYADSKGRVWMIPFKNSICYYYKGKIHNPDNDPVLKKIKLTSVPHILMESYDHEMSIFTGQEFITIRNDTLVDIFPLPPLKNYIVRPGALGKGFSMHLMLPAEACYFISGGTMQRVDCSKIDQHIVNSDVPALNAVRKNQKHNSEDYTRGVDALLFTNTWNGSWMIDTTTYTRYTELLLKGKQVGHGMVDQEKNIWLTTLGEGVYKLPSREFKTYIFKSTVTSEIHSFTKKNGKLYAGSGFGRIYIYNGKTIDTLNVHGEFKKSLNLNAVDRAISLQLLKDGSLLVGLDGFLLKRKNNKNYINTDIFPVKAIDTLPNGQLLVATGKRACIADAESLAIKDTILHQRSTSICYYNNDYYIGTVQGLFIVNKNKQVRFMGDVYPVLRQRIACINRAPNGLLWLATYGNGVICMKNDKVIGRITTKEGLTSNVCRSLFINNNILWVGTDKGLNKVNTSQLPYAIINYSTADGLPSNSINTIYTDSNIIYVGSPAGLTYFDEKRIINYSKCKLRLLDVTIGSKRQPLQNKYEIHYRENSLKIAYAGISFKSGGSIWYRYRLKGLSDVWDSTSQPSLEYPSLPPGKYQLELFAVNKKGIVSDPLQIAFVVAAPFWQTWPFQVGVVIVTALITWLVVAWRFSIVRKKERERATIQHKLNELEQMALRSQMNPHFIFNCLNSIQNFIIKNDLESSNWYLSEFAHLIRQTLDNSEKSTISITNEVKYLRRFLELEKMRFSHSFNYSIEVDPEIDSDLIGIPTMVLQPFIENAIRHGIRYKEEGAGLVIIKFEKSGEGFIATIEDNGIGRQKARALKSKLHVEYQSKGMSLTAERINILNRQLPESITITIDDLTDEQGIALGTRVTLRFPFDL